MKVLYAKKTDVPLKIEDERWNLIKEEKLDCFNQNNNSTYPETVVKLCWSEKGLAVKFHSMEKNALARYSGKNEPVYLDSCVEFFFNPNPTSDRRYLNFELSAGKGLLIGLREKRKDKKYLDFQTEMFDVETEIHNGDWYGKLFIPFSFILRYYDIIENVFLGNFYKCGDETEIKHYLSWNKVETDRPDFHRPDCFGKIILIGR